MRGEWLTELAMMASFQQEKLLALGRQIVPNLTEDDLLQPNDFPELENHGPFRYEEGLLAGIRAAAALLQGRKGPGDYS